MNLDLLIFLRFGCSHGKSCFTTVWENMCAIFFPSIKTSKSKKGECFFSTTQVVVKGHYLPRHVKGEIWLRIHHLEMMKITGMFFVVCCLFLVCFGLSSEIVTSSVIDDRWTKLRLLCFCLQRWRIHANVSNSGCHKEINWRISSLDIEKHPSF